MSQHRNRRKPPGWSSSQSSRPRRALLLPAIAAALLLFLIIISSTLIFSTSSALAAPATEKLLRPQANNHSSPSPPHSTPPDAPGTPPCGHHAPRGPNPRSSICSDRMRGPCPTCRLAAPLFRHPTTKPLKLTIWPQMAVMPPARVEKGVRTRNRGAAASPRVRATTRAQRSGSTSTQGPARRTFFRPGGVRACVPAAMAQRITRF